eukprot:TRINITY_DN6002_c0_g1_i2.p1 TRINITY_DN6002_c0_g1~~TRINITY_DN6002_c0_g1_i2.p1  ORF type:complete len:581 (+),score=85.84 TRINITY_DN6002_c0_g1_i2:51-1793(+)
MKPFFVTTVPFLFTLILLIHAVSSENCTATEFSKSDDLTNCTIIDGSLIIERTTNLDFLGRIEIITGELKILLSNLTDYSKFDALTLVGDLTIGYDSVAENITFPSLQSVRSLSIYHCTALRTYSFPVLRTVVSLMNMLSNPLVSDVSFPMLEYIGTSTSINTHDSLSLIHFPALTFSGGGIEIKENDSLNEVIYPKLEYIDWNILIYYNNNLTKINFPVLNGSEGYLVIKNNPELTDVGFESLVEVTGLTTNSIEIIMSPKLTNLSLDSLRYTARSIVIEDTAITNLDTLSNLRKIGSGIIIQNNTLLQNIDGLVNLTDVHSVDIDVIPSCLWDLYNKFINSFNYVLNCTELTNVPPTSDSQSTTSSSTLNSDSSTTTSNSASTTTITSSTTTTSNSVPTTTTGISTSAETSTDENVLIVSENTNFQDEILFFDRIVIKNSGVSFNNVTILAGTIEIESSTITLSDGTTIRAEDKLIITDSTLNVQITSDQTVSITENEGLQLISTPETEGTFTETNVYVDGQQSSGYVLQYRDDGVYLTKSIDLLVIVIVLAGIGVLGGSTYFILRHVLHERFIQSSL